MGRSCLALALITAAIALSIAGFGAPPRIEFLGKETARTDSAPQGGILYFVNSTGDGGNVGPVTQCDDGTDHCTLRAAIQAANGYPGEDSIQIDLLAGSIINLTHALPDITESVSITGPGADKLTVRRNTGGTYGIFNVTTASTVAFAGLTISNGSVPSQGGGAGIANSTGTVNISNCMLSGNSATNNGAGGGIFNGIGTVTVTNCTLSGNSAVNGGGIFNSGGTVVVANSTISGNSTVDGGGIYSGSGTVTIINSTLSGNSATSTGGGIHSDSGGVIITNSTLSGNGANQGGGIDSGDAIARARNTIIAKNTATTGPDISGALTSQGYNLIGNNSGAIITPTTGDQIGTAGSPIDPLLDPLRDNGGPTLTHALLAGSPAIDKGHSSGSSTDQRGFNRTFDDPAVANATGGDGTDIGAFERAHLQITSISRLANGHVLLQGLGAANAAHTIQASSGLSANSFTTVGISTANGGGVLQFDDAGAVGLTKRFYRLSFP